METYLEILSTYPTAVYTVLLIVVTLYWLLSAVGVLGVDALDGLFGLDLGSDAGGDSAESGAVAALLNKFGLGGIPLMVLFTLIALVGWSVCYLTELHLLRGMTGITGLLARSGTLVAGLLLSIPVARVVLSPVRALMRRHRPVSQAPQLGRIATVRSPEITQTSGTAEVDDGGAGLILQVRHATPGLFVRGDRVVLIEYLREHNAYRVISCEEFDAL